MSVLKLKTQQTWNLKKTAVSEVISHLNPKHYDMFLGYLIYLQNVHIKITVEEENEAQKAK